MNFRILFISILFFSGMSAAAWATVQDSVQTKRASSMSQNSLNKAASKLSKSLDENMSDEKVAADYVALAAELFAGSEYEKSEEYLQRAKQTYSKLKNKEKLYEVNRELAKVQEAQGKIDEAIQSLNEAAKTAPDRARKKIAQNNVERLKNYELPVNQSDFINRNIVILEKEGKPEEKAAAYSQMAETNLQMKQTGAAIENYEKALQNVQNETPEAVMIQQKIAEVYVADQQLDKAIDINEEIIEKAKQRDDVETQIEQMQTLSNIYLADNNADKSIELLTQAYSLSLEKGNTIEAKNSLELLVEQYLNRNQYQKSIDLYKNFLDNLETLIRADSSLVDARIFQITEERIERLEKEKTLTEQLIREKNIFNRVLIGSIVLMFILLLFIAKALYSIKIKNKKIALQSLRREMNPHFIFNSLNSINQFIALNNELEANKYLTSYSKLMRNMMENSNKDFIRLSKEIEHLAEYLELENLRFKDKFSFEIFVDHSIEIESTTIPNMLIQPHLENAIWHGLRYKETAGLLSLQFLRRENGILIRIEDDGIGLTRSHEIKTKNQRVHESRGLTNIDERIRLLNELYNTNISYCITEKEHPQSGVIVEIQFPAIQTENQMP